MKFRTATMEDITEISEIRKKQIQDEGQTPDIDIDEELHRYFEKYMKSGYEDVDFEMEKIIK